MSGKLHLNCMKTEAVKRTKITFNSYNYNFFLYSFSKVFLLFFLKNYASS